MFFLLTGGMCYGNLCFSTQKKRCKTKEYENLCGMYCTKGLIFVTLQKK